jgi:hypothetical protein
MVEFKSTRIFPEDFDRPFTSEKGLCGGVNSWRVCSRVAQVAGADMQGS